LVEPDPDLERHDPLAALRQPNFLLYAVSRVFAGTGQSLLQAVMAWQVYDISHSSLNLGLLGLARFFPALGASMIGGLTADALDRRKVMLASGCVPLACAIILSLATFGHWISVDLIFGLVVLIGLGSAFEAPARTALLPGIVSRETFANAVTVNNIFQKLGSTSGPALAGLVIAVAGTGFAYLVFCFSIVGAFIPLVLLHYERVGSERQKFSLQAIKEGIRFVRDRQVLLGAMTLDMFAVIFGGAAALLPVYASDILKAGPTGYGILTASMQAGAFLMSFVLVWRPPVQRTGRALIYTVVFYGLATMAFGISREFVLSVFLYALIGAIDQVSVVMRQTTIQMATPDELRGRVSSVNQVFVQASSQIGAIESGFVAALTTATFSVVSGGAIAIAVAGAIRWRMPLLFEYVVNRRPVLEAVAAEEAAVAGGS
jgi:MFS family permease